MPETLSSSSKSLNFGRAPAGLGPQMRWLMKSVIPAIGRALGVKISIQGAESATQEVDGAMNFKVGSGDGVSPKRGLQVYFSASTAVSVRPGTVLGLMPTISGTALDAATPTPPALSCEINVTRYVVVNLDTTLSTTAYSTETFVDNATANTATITLDTTLPGASDLISVTGDFKFLLATIVNGVITQNGYASITGYVCDNGSANGTGQLNHQTT